MRKNLLILFTLLALVLPAAALANDGKAKATVKITKAEREMAEAITAEQLKDYLYFIASDAMGGRDTPSAGLDITAQFLALNLKRWGFKPAPGGDGTFFQKMTVLKPKPATADQNSLNIDGKNIAFGDEMLRFDGDMMADAPIVFVGNGWMVKSKGIDAYAEVDVKDKVVAIYNPKASRRSLSPLPEGITNADLTGTRGTDWADPITYAKANGAKGIIVIASNDLDKGWDNIKRSLSRGGRMQIEGLDSNSSSDGGSIPMLIVRKNVAKSILENEDIDKLSTKAVVTNKSAKIKTGSSIERIPTQNVVAVWEGDEKSDVRDEYVAIGAHYDHVGTRPNASGDDKIWNGADDDGSGTTAVLAIAETLAKSQKRPKRSILLVWHAGEEKGLLGAKYFNKYPTVDIKKVTTQLNIDMIGRSKTPDMKVVECTGGNRCNSELTGPNEVYVIGSEMMSSKLGEITKATNSSYMNLNYNYKYDDPNDKNRFFFRSDHFHYAENGIPIAFWFTGTHLDYHGAGDHADKIDYAKMEKITRTIFLTMWKLAELDERPAVDKELPPELKVRN